MSKASTRRPGRFLSYKSLMAGKGIDNIPEGAALALIANLIDESHSPRRKAGIKRALDWCDQLEARGLSPRASARLNYYRANAWDTRRPKGRSQLSASKRWEQPALSETIHFLRRARRSEGFAELHELEQCQILTNLGNSLSAAERFVEALELWTQALGRNPSFWMARGNRGSCLARYGRSHYDVGARLVLIMRGHADLAQAIADAHDYPFYGHPEALAHFEKQKMEIERNVDVAAVAADFREDGYSLGKTSRERSYRSWCLQNGLFLNPLNDLGAASVAARDVLLLPDLQSKSPGPPPIIGFFNQLKQEYVSARWSYFDGSQTYKTHFSDRDVFLFNTLDYPSYGLGTEQIRTAFRTAYSIFDKLAFFLNAYLDLGVPDNKVWFEHIWRESGGKGPKPIRRRFTRSYNGPLRGLYWLSRDIFDDSLRQYAEPDAQELHEVRRNLEHRYLKVHEILIGPAGRRSATDDPFVDTLAFSMSRDDLEVKTLRILKLARAALIYLSLGVHREERIRARRRKNVGLVLDQSLPKLEHDRRR